MDIYEVITKHEGVRSFPYCDKCGEEVRPTSVGWTCLCVSKGETPGFLTIGVGHNLEAAPLTDGLIDALLRQDVADVESYLCQLTWFKNLTGVRREAIIDAAFCVGVKGIQAFTRMIDPIRARVWPRAADQMLHSTWARQEPQRAKDDAHALEFGEWVLP